MHVFGSSRKPKQKCFNVGDTEHLPEGDIQRQSGPSSSLMASRTQILSLSDCHPQSYPSWSQGGCHSSRPTSTHNIQTWKEGCLLRVSLYRSKKSFPSSPQETSHTPLAGTGHMSMSKPETGKRDGATCLHQWIRIYPPWVGERWAWKRHTAIRWKISMFCLRHLPY